MKMMASNRLAAFAVIVVAAVVLPRDANAQGQFVMPGQEEEGGQRSFIIQVGLGGTLPVLHLGAKDEFDDCYATSGTTIIFRAYFPFTRKIDFMLDLSLPKFNVNQTEFVKQTSVLIEDAFYKGKILSLGARWFAMPSLTEKGFFTASAGMYQLIWDRFLNGRRDKYTVIRGGYKPGFAVGCGMQFELGPVSMDGTLRFHHYLDSRTFGEGGLGWLELSFQAAIDGSK